MNVKSQKLLLVAFRTFPPFERSDSHQLFKVSVECRICRKPTFVSNIRNRGICGLQKFTCRVDTYGINIFQWAHLHVGSNEAEGLKSKLNRTTMMVLAVTLHNIPEGMAVGVMYAGFLAGNTQITAASALALSIGIAIQNFPEGAIISMPLKAEGVSKGKAFLGGVLSGVVEPIGAVLTILISQRIIPLLPYLLSFAAGAMLYVVVEELIPEMSQGKHSNIGAVFFAVGFSLMMVLDVALG